MYGQGARNPDSSTGKVPVPHQNGQGALTPKSGKVLLLPNGQDARAPNGKALQSGCLAVFYLCFEMLTTASGLLTFFKIQYIRHLPLHPQKKRSQLLVYLKKRCIFATEINIQLHVHFTHIY